MAQGRDVFGISVDTLSITCSDTDANDTLDVPTDRITIHFSARYERHYAEDTVAVALLPAVTGLGSVTASESYDMTCAGQSAFTVVWDSAATVGNDSVRVFGTISVRPPNGVNVPSGTDMTFFVVFHGRSTDGSYLTCEAAPFTRSLPCAIYTVPGCGAPGYTEFFGFQGDGILVVGDSLWWEFNDTYASAPGESDTFYIDFSSITGVDADSMVYPGRGNGILIPEGVLDDATPTTLQTTRFNWVTADSANTDTSIRDCALSVLIDNITPTMTAACLGGCQVIDGNSVDNINMAGAGDILRIKWYSITGGSFTCAGGTVGGHDRNNDAGYLAAWFGAFLDSTLLVNTGHTFRYPINSDTLTHQLLPADDDTLRRLWISSLFSLGGNNDTVYLDIPIDTIHWTDSLQSCILNALAERGDTIWVLGLDNAGNRAPWNYLECDVCLDNFPTPIPTGNEPYYLEGPCLKRFSPYDTRVTDDYANISPDSIVWYLDRVDGEFDINSESDRLNKVYLVGFDVRSEPDQNPDSPTGPIIARLNYINPGAPLPVDTNLQTYWTRVPFPDKRAVDDIARFEWFGRSRQDSLAPWMPIDQTPIDDITDAFWNCPNGLLTGITFARWEDMSGNNAIAGSDHDNRTDISQHYSTLNILQAVTDVCPPSVVTINDTLNLINDPPLLTALVDTGSSSSVTAFIWDGPNGGPNPNPWLHFQPKRFFTQGLLDSCLQEDTLFYHIRVDSIFTTGTWPGGAAILYYDSLGYSVVGATSADLWEPIVFDAHDVNGPDVTFRWGHGAGVPAYLPDGLYQLTLEVRDQAGNVYRDPIFILLNGTGPQITNVQFVGPDSLCKTDFFLGDEWCVKVTTDKTADSVLVDWSCVFHGPTTPTVLRTPAAETDTTFIWMTCISVADSNLDTTAVENNLYGFSSPDDCALDAEDRLPIKVSAFDGPTLFAAYSAPDTNSCRWANLGRFTCPYMFTRPEFFYYIPDSVTRSPLFAASVAPYDVFGAYPNYNSFSPGAASSNAGCGNYDADLNWARDCQQDSIFIRLILDANSISTDTTDTLVLQITNLSDPTRFTILRKALWVPASMTDTSLVTDPNHSNTIYDGALYRWPANPNMIEFVWLWNGTWYLGAGQDSTMLVRWNESDSVSVRAWTINGTGTSVCPAREDTLFVDNENPDFLSWTGAPASHDPITGSTPTVKNVGVGTNCGFRFGDNTAFQLDVVMSEWVRPLTGMEPDWYHRAGSNPDANAFWPITRNWQISAIDRSTQRIVTIGGDTVDVQVDSVVVAETFANDSIRYRIYGSIDLPASTPAEYVNDNVTLVIRSAWDQAGNPGRYNNPPFTDHWFNDASEDTSFHITLVNFNPWAVACGTVYDIQHPTRTGWIGAEDSLRAEITIVETPYISLCEGAQIDSVRQIWGNFQNITDDPNPWILNNDGNSGRFAYIVNGDTIGWARTFYWLLRADNADLATRYCDGAYLSFEARFNTVQDPTIRGPHTYSNCVQVDVNDPVWDAIGANRDSSTVNDTTCFPNPALPIMLFAHYTDNNIDGTGCGTGVGVDTTMLYADISGITGVAADTMVAADSINTAAGYAFWLNVLPNPEFIGNASRTAIWWTKAATDWLAHTDYELIRRDTVCFFSDTLPPAYDEGFAACFRDLPKADNIFPTHTYVSPGNEFAIIARFTDPDSGRSLGMGHVWADLSRMTDTLGWIAPDESSIIDNQMMASWGWLFVSKLPDHHHYTLLSTFNNLDPAQVRFLMADSLGNMDSTGWVTVATVDTLPPIVDAIYVIGNDSIPEYVTPGDTSVLIYADLIPGDHFMGSGPVDVTADVSKFECAPFLKNSNKVIDWSDLPASIVLQNEANPEVWRAFWGYDSVWYNDRWNVIENPIHIPVCGNLPELQYLTGPEGLYNFIYVHVADSACNIGEHYIQYEYSGADSLVPDVEAVSVVTNTACAITDGFISSLPNDGGHIEVWAWMDTLFNSLSDTAHIASGGSGYVQVVDSMLADLTPLDPTNPAYLWMPCVGTTPHPGTQGHWEVVEDGEGRDRLVAKWTGLTALDKACNDRVDVTVRSIRRTGPGGQENYYQDFERGYALVDTTRPVITDMRLHSSVASEFVNDFVSPNVDLYVDVWAYDTNCDTTLNHLGFVTTPEDGSYITFCNTETGFDTLWTWDTTHPVVLSQVDSLNMHWIHLRWIGVARFGAACNTVDLNNIAGCVTAYVEDCLSNQSDPMTRETRTDDAPPYFSLLDAANAATAWGDFTYPTGMPGNPDLTPTDSVIVLGRGIYNLRQDSILRVSAIVWDSTWIDTTLTKLDLFPLFTDGNRYQTPDSIIYNVGELHRDSIVWIIPLFDGTDPLYNTTVESNRYWFPMFFSDTLDNNTTLYCIDTLYDSALSFTIQNWNEPNPGMVLICDSNTVTPDTNIADAYNMALWNNEKVSSDAEKKNLSKVYFAPGSWAWYSHDSGDQTRFFIFVEDPVLQNDDIDNDADGSVDELGEGVDFYTADLRINTRGQAAHVDSMNVNGATINYLWFADNFSQGTYNVDLYISDIYGHRDTLTCEEHALTFMEDETCPHPTTLGLFAGTTRQAIRRDDIFLPGDLDLAELNANDSLFVSTNFDSLSLWIADDPFLLTLHPGSGIDVDTTNAVSPDDSVNWNEGRASTIELVNPNGVVIPEFTQQFYADSEYYQSAPLTLMDPTHTALVGQPDGRYIVRITALDRMGNSCSYEWTIILDRTCPTITSLFVSRPGLNTPVTDLMASWDHVELNALINDSLDGVDHVVFDYAYDANRDGQVDAYSFWQTANILNANGSNVVNQYPFRAYWDIRNLPWTGEDTLGLPPVEPGCTNTYFVRVHAFDIYQHECIDTITVHITDDIAPVAAMTFPAQGMVTPCYNPNVAQGDSIILVFARDSVRGGYDPNPNDLFVNSIRWFDLLRGTFQYKFFEAPGVVIPGNTDPAAGWVMMRDRNQDTITFRNDIMQNFQGRWNIVGLPSHQYNIRFVGIDPCGNTDELNTPVITVRMECDTTAPVAEIIDPLMNARLTNYRCNEDSTGNAAWVLVQSVSPIWSDVDSVAFYFIDSLTTPGTGIHTFISGSRTPDHVVAGEAIYYATRWNTDHLLSGTYWLYAVAHDASGHFDTNWIPVPVYVDNTAPVMGSCLASTTTTWEDSIFTLSATPTDPDGGQIGQVTFQYLDRFGNWTDLHTANNVGGLYGADISTSPNPVMAPDAEGAYTITLQFRDFDQSPLDSIRFRSIATDIVMRGDPNVQGDRDRDCMVDRDLVCGTDVCCMAVEIRDRVPFGTDMDLYNHGAFAAGLPSVQSENLIITGDRFTTCNNLNPLDSLLLRASVNDSVEDGWEMHFKFRRSWPVGSETAWDYVPNNTTLNPAIPAYGPITLFHTWENVYVIWTQARSFMEAADAAAGLTYSEWTFTAQVSDLTGNMEPLMAGNTTTVVMSCIPQAPITEVSFMDPVTRQRHTSPVNWQDANPLTPDTIEVVYNRTTGPGYQDPEALVEFYTDAASIMNCRNVELTPFNLELWRLGGDTTLEAVCWNGPVKPFDNLDRSIGFDQYPPDDANNNRYTVGLYLNNRYTPGLYNFAMVLRTDSVQYPTGTVSYAEGNSYYDFSDGRALLDSRDITRVDVVVKVVNVNQPELTFCQPVYGASCIHGTVPMAASVVPNPTFTGVIDTVWFQYYNGSNWLPVVDPATGLNYDTESGASVVRFELNESEVPGMAGWYYEQSSHNIGNRQLAWQAGRDLFPRVAVWINGQGITEMTRDNATGRWTADIALTYTGATCFDYNFIVDANDNHVWDEDGTDRWITDPRDACETHIIHIGGGEGGHDMNVSQMCVCDYMVNFPSRDYANSSYNFRTVVGWHDAEGGNYHVMENPAPGDSIHTFFVDNSAPEATHDIEFATTRLSGGMFRNDGGDPDICNPADTLYFVTDIQPNGTHNLVVEDICKVIYQVSLTNNPTLDNGWENVATVYSNDQTGWTEQWPATWIARNPLNDNIDNDGDGTVDETHEVQVGDNVGEENMKFWTRSVVVDVCGNTYVSAPESIWVDVSAPQACVTEVGGVLNPDNQIVNIPASRDLTIIATDQSYADPGVTAIFQYRTLNPIGAWLNIQADTLSNDTVRHIGNTYTAVWDLLAYFQQTGVDPEGFYQLRVIAEDTVGNNDLCDNVVCQVTIRLNDLEPAARVEIFSITNAVDSASACTPSGFLYIEPSAPYCVKAFFAPTNTDTGLASVTFQYQSIALDGAVSEWRNIETISGHYENGLHGDTTRCVSFQPIPTEIDDHGFNIRAIVEDYNGNDTSAVKTLYVDGSAAIGAGAAAPTVMFDGPCGERCRLDTANAIINVTFLPDAISHEVNVATAWLTVVRNDGTNRATLGELFMGADSTWTFNFGGDLCAFWSVNDLAMGCYNMSVHYIDCAGNEDSLAVMTDCGNGPTDLICVDCVPALPILASLDVLTYASAECDEEGYTTVTLTDSVLDGTTEIGNETVTICGTLPAYQQYIEKVYLYVESPTVLATIVDSVMLDGNTDRSYCFHWNVAALDTAGQLIYPSGYYRVWVRAVDATCAIQAVEPVDQFFVHVDNAAPLGTITQVNGVTPTPGIPTRLEVVSGGENPAYLNVDWTDGLVPDDATQPNNRVQVWAKSANQPNQANTWAAVGEVPSPCNPHFVLWTGDYACGDTLDLVVVVQDRFGNGNLDANAAVAAFTAGRTVSVLITDTTPPATQLWSIGAVDSPADPTSVLFNQQNHMAQIPSNLVNQNVYLQSFSAQGDLSIVRVYFQYSLDGTTWVDIATDNTAAVPPDCEGMATPLPWWCGNEHPILWSALWDISGLQGNVWVRTWAQDRCGNNEVATTYVVSIDVAAPMAKVYAWMSDVNVDNVPCNAWTEAQIADSLERFSTLTVGACPDSVGTQGYDAYGTFWYIKRADTNPLEATAWCAVGHDSTAPFSVRPVNLWDNACTQPQPGVWYDVAVLTTDRSGHALTWTQFLNHGVGTTWEEKWAWLQSHGYVKRFKAVDHTAPIAHSLTATPDMTPDSSVMYLTGNVTLGGMIDATDAVALTFAVREASVGGPWTIIERTTTHTNNVWTLTHTWNTELLNGTYVIGAFAEDNAGNMDGNIDGTGAGPHSTLTVNIDNQRPNGTITSVTRNGLPIVGGQLERGATHQFLLNATDNFGIRSVALRYRAANGPAEWTTIGTDVVWPYSFDWVIPPTLIPGWSYQFQAVATDLVYLTDEMDGQGQYIVDTTFTVVDNEANIALTTIGGMDATLTPHVNGTNVILTAESDPMLDNVRFVFVRGTDTTLIGTDVDVIGTVDWSMTWDVTAITEGPAQVGVIGSADLGGNVVTRGYDFRNIVIDHSVATSVAANLPLSYGLVGGVCEYSQNPVYTDDLWIRFNTEGTDTGVDSVWFEYKATDAPNIPASWSSIGVATLDNGVTGNWAYAWNATSLDCGLITLRARVSDNAVPTSNVAYVIFADSVRVDNCAPIVNITNINGDVTPADAQIAQGTVATITATVTDALGNGGNSTIDSVAFYYMPVEQGGGGEPIIMNPDWIFIGLDANGAPWQTMWNTGGAEVGAYTIIAVAWDHAGNCGTTENDIMVVNHLQHHAYIVGWDKDNEPGCDDNLIAITDDCTPDITARVVFQYSTDNGASWIHLGEDQNGYSVCDEFLYYRMWRLDLELDAIPASAVYRAVAYGPTGIPDPKPARFQWSDVTNTAQSAIYNPEYVRVTSPANHQQPWVFGALEDYTGNCVSHWDMVCVRPWQPDSSSYTGALPEGINPCAVNGEWGDRDGQIDIFSGVPVTRIVGNDTLQYMTFNTYKTMIHQITFENGSNGWLQSEDNVMRVFVPTNATTTNGFLWFEPVQEADYVNLIPPSQYYYSLLSKVEAISSSDLTSATITEDTTHTGDWGHLVRIKMRFNPALLPQGYQPWQVVPAFYDNDNDQMWSERGIVYVNRDSLAQGMIDFQYSVEEDEWDPSDETSGTSYCSQIKWAVMLTTVQPLNAEVQFADAFCDDAPDMTYYTPTRGPSMGTDPTFWAVMRQGEYLAPDSTIDVYLDGVRIVNNGRPDPAFEPSYNQVSGVYSVRFSANAYNIAPWYGELRHGQHTVQFYANNLHTSLTPFFVDHIAPEAYTYPGYINHQVNLWANLTDGESGVDTASVYAIISDCTPSAFTFRTLFEMDTLHIQYGDSDYTRIDSFAIGLEVLINDARRAYIVENQAMTFSPVAGGYRAAFTQQWEQLQQWLIANNNAGTMCVTWAFKNKVCMWNDSTSYTYTVDVQAPIVMPISPVGAGIDDDGDGLVNEDWADCINNDNDVVWDSTSHGWRERLDEDPINFVADTINFGERPTIQAVINDLAMCGSGASGVDVPGIWLNIDGHIFRPADTTAAGLNFRIMWPNGMDDAYLTFGGPTSGVAADPYYAPGEHRITVAAPDSAGNVGNFGSQFSWTYYIRASGPAIAFDTTGACGVWFDPTVRNEFRFCVDATGNTPIMANGIQYSVITVPDGILISGPTTVNPTNPTHHCVNYVLQGSFPQGQTGIEILVAAENILYNAQGDTTNGITRTRMTFWADNLDPHFVSHMPADSTFFTRDQAIVIEAFFSDDSPSDMKTSSEKTGGTKGGKAQVVVGRKNNDGTVTTLSKQTVNLSKNTAGQDGRNGSSLDDNGSGIRPLTAHMTIIMPNGSVITIPDATHQFLEVDNSHVKYVLVSGQAAGAYTVNLNVADCVGNIGSTSWPFFVRSAAPVIAYLAAPAEGECEYDGYWNPAYPLHLRATVREMDGVNIAAEGIRVDVLRVYTCPSGICTDTLIANASKNFIGGDPDPLNTAQTLRIEAAYNTIDHSVDASEIRIVVTATNMLGVTASSVQPFVVDRTAPWITVINPSNGSTLPTNQSVMISANFGDDPAALVAKTSGGSITKNGDTRNMTDVGPTRKGLAGKSVRGRGWDGAITNSLDDLDGNSGIDRSCITMLLLHNQGGAVDTLTAHGAIITPNNITWIGNLSAGGYTVILSVCDRVCNTNSINWGFTVAEQGNAGVVYNGPYYVSGMPRVFTMRTFGESIDRATMRLDIQGMRADTLAPVMIVTDAPVQSLGDSVWYTANFDLDSYVQLRLTLHMNFTYGTAVPTGSQIYTIDASAPQITGVTPDPQTPLVTGSSPAFTVSFAEVGPTSIDSSSVRVWLENISTSAAVAGQLTITLDGARHTGTARLAVANLPVGDYRLYAHVADIAGNGVDASWNYTTTPLIVPDSLTRESAYNYPNPFGPADNGTKFHLPISGNGGGTTVAIKIYDFSGQFVATVYEGAVSGADDPNLVWNGTNSDGEMVANGVYLAHVKTSVNGQTKEDVVKVAFKNKK
jgi:hypothetical protein